MKRTLPAIAALAASLAAVFFLGMHCGSCPKERCGGENSEFGLNLLASRSSAAAEAKFIMQWDNARKKLVFNDKSISHEWKNVGNAWNCKKYAVEYSAAPAEYSFDWESIRDSRASLNLGKIDGQLHYYIEWDESNKRFQYDESQFPSRYQRQGFNIFIARD
jgi:hypothetical protein